MSELQAYYDNYARAGGWQHEDAEHCGCGGSGWWLSEVDTWHRCGIHGTDENARHPEDYDYEGDESMDGDHESGLASAGFGTDEDYGGYDYEDDGGW